MSFAKSFSSKFGMFSLLFGVMSLLLFLINISILFLDPSFRIEAADPTPVSVETAPDAARPDPADPASPETLPMATPADLRFVLLTVLSVGANAVAFALGMGGLLQDGQNKAMAVSGLTLSGLVFIMYCCGLSTMIPAA